MKKMVFILIMVAGLSAHAEMCPNMNELVHREISKFVSESSAQAESIHVTIGGSNFRDAWVYGFSFLDSHGHQFLGSVMVDTATCKVASIGYGAAGKLLVTEK